MASLALWICSATEAMALPHRWSGKVCNQGTIGELQWLLWAGIRHKCLRVKRVRERTKPPDLLRWAHSCPTVAQGYAAQLRIPQVEGSCRPLPQKGHQFPSVLDLRASLMPALSLFCFVTLRPLQKTSTPSRWHVRARVACRKTNEALPSQSRDAAPKRQAHH